MLRLLLVAAGAYWLRKPENRELASRKLKEGWDSVVSGHHKPRHNAGRRDPLNPDITRRDPLNPDIHERDL